MNALTAQQIWNLPDPELTALLDSDILRTQTGTVRFYAPSFSPYQTPDFCASTTAFPTISVTGNTCALGCRHCGGKVLKTMQSATTPTELWNLGVNLKSRGARGVLVSGGCLPDGSVPLAGFASVLARFKRELALTVFVHSGIVDSETAVALAAAGVDAALIDVLGSEQTIRNVLRLEVSLRCYADSLKALDAAKLPVIPHVIVGLNGGALDGEYAALQTIQQTLRPAAVVIIAFMPIPGTDMAQTPPPTPLCIARVAAAARALFPQTPLALGCMRPKGKHRDQTDVLALKAGVDAIAYPSTGAVQYAKTLGAKAVYSPFCCAQMYRDFKK
ncbi:MAG: radical SAM protein [Candidatus Bathyarchaeota archaeon]|nr:radical SAM protein [Candidatus Bathyarchaeota archaeon]